MSEPGDSKHRLEKAKVAYDRGDFVSMRSTLRGLLAQNPPDDVRDEAHALLGRLRPDPAAIVLAVGCLVLFLLVFWAYVIR